MYSENESLEAGLMWRELERLEAETRSTDEVSKLEIALRSRGRRVAELETTAQRLRVALWAVSSGVALAGFVWWIR
jgi:hypothetical protein